jgi:hypothetical protein
MPKYIVKCVANITTEIDSGYFSEDDIAELTVDGEIDTGKLGAKFKDLVEEGELGPDGIDEITITSISVTLDTGSEAAKSEG